MKAHNEAITYLIVIGAALFVAIAMASKAREFDAVRAAVRVLETEVARDAARLRDIRYRVEELESHLTARENIYSWEVDHDIQ